MKQLSATRVVLAWAVRLAVIAALVMVFLLRPSPTGKRTVDTASIDTYNASMDLRTDGTLDIDEQLDVEMPPGKHGIFRIFDTRDPRRRDVRHLVTVDSVERDGQTEPYTEVKGAAGTRTIRIGDAFTTLDPGVHRYRIRSHTSDVFEPGDDAEALWWWDVVGQGWQMEMRSVDITAQLPTAPRSIRCVQGEDTPCTATVDGTTMHLHTGPLAPFTPVTVKAAFPANAVTVADGSRIATLIAAIVAGLLGAGLAALLFTATREQAPGLPVLFEPPSGISPALGVRVLREENASAELQAMLFQLADRGLLRIEGDGDSWTVHVIGDPTSGQLDRAETVLLTGLGLLAVGNTFTVSRSVSAGQAIAATKKSLSATVNASAQPFLKASGAGYLAIALGWIATIALGFLVKRYFDTGWLWWPALIGLGAFSFVALSMMFDTRVLTKRTPEGRELWSRAGGFARFLTTDSSESRFEAAEHLDWYPRYLPWAVALGVADAWAKRYEAQGVNVPEVPWLLWMGPYGSGFSVGQMTDSFNSSISAASAAYAASQAASSGGGGFSGGSGGGGGGGGSW